MEPNVHVLIYSTFKVLAGIPAYLQCVDDSTSTREYSDIRTCRVFLLPSLIGRRFNDYICVAARQFGRKSVKGTR